MVIVQAILAVVVGAEVHQVVAAAEMIPAVAVEEDAVVAVINRFRTLLHKI